MVAYKLHYFAGRGTGEIARQIFAFAGVEYEDKRYTFEDWPNHKAEMPFGQMPVLEFDGKKLPQSFAIARYLARKFNLAGKCDWSSAQVDALADQWKDFMLEIKPYVVVNLGFAPGDKDQLRKAVFLPAVQKHFPIFEKAAFSSGSGFLVGDSITWVDLMVAGYLSQLIKENANVIDAFPALKTLDGQVAAIPSIKKWRGTRPETPF